MSRAVRMIGKRIGSYHILEKLGQGGMGEVYKAKDDRLKRLVAIKVLRNDKVTRREGELRFLQEARAASALNHRTLFKSTNWRQKTAMTISSWSSCQAGHSRRCFRRSVSALMRL